ncbi:MAG: hypothetical protein Q9166_004876 [cf. Caloplaca sp. 2 TL-2023]
MAPSKETRRADFSRPQSKRPKTRNLVRWNDDMDKKLLLTVQWACNIKGVKIPWEMVATEMGPTVTAGAVIQHLAKFRSRMVAHGADVPPPLTRGGNNHNSNLTALKAAQIDKGDKSAKAMPGRRNTKRAAKKTTRDEESEDTEDDSFQIDGGSDAELSGKRSNKAKGKAKAKRVSRNQKGAKAKQRTAGEFTEAIKDEPVSSVEAEDEQPRYGVGDTMFEMGGTQDSYSSTKRTGSSKSSSQSPYLPSKIVVLNVGRTGLAKLGRSDDTAFKPEDDNSHDEDASEGSSNIHNNHQMGHESNSTEISDFRDPGAYHEENLSEGNDFGLLERSHFEEELIASSALYGQNHSQAMSGFDGKSSALARGAHGSSHGNLDHIVHGDFNASDVSEVTKPGIHNSKDHHPASEFGNQSFVHPSMAKPGNQIPDYARLSQTGQQAPLDMAECAAYHGYEALRLPSQTMHTGSYGSHGSIGNPFPERETVPLNRSRFTNQAYNPGGERSSFSSMDSYHPVGGEFPGFSNVGMGIHSETPVAMSRNNSELDHMSSSFAPEHDAGMSWTSFLDADGHDFGC